MITVWETKARHRNKRWWVHTSSSSCRKFLSDYYNQSRSPISCSHCRLDFERPTNQCKGIPSLSGIRRFMWYTSYCVLYMITDRCKSEKIVGFLISGLLTFWSQEFFVNIWRLRLDIKTLGVGYACINDHLQLKRQI